MTRNPANLPVLNFPVPVRVLNRTPTAWDRATHVAPLAESTTTHSRERQDVSPQNQDWQSGICCSTIDGHCRAISALKVLCSCHSSGRFTSMKIADVGRISMDSALFSIHDSPASQGSTPHASPMFRPKSSVSRRRFRLDCERKLYRALTPCVYDAWQSVPRNDSRQLMSSFTRRWCAKHLFPHRSQTHHRPRELDRRAC